MTNVYRIGSHPITPAATLLVLVATSVLALRLLRVRWSLLPLCLVGAYGGRRLGLDTGLVKGIDHHVLTPVSDTFDNIEWWLAVALASALVAVALRRRLHA